MKQIKIFSILFKAFIKCFLPSRKWRKMGTAYRKAGSRPVNKTLCCIDLKRKHAECLLLIQMFGLRPLIFLLIQISLLFSSCYLWNTMNNSYVLVGGGFKPEINFILMLRGNWKIIPTWSLQVRVKFSSWYWSLFYLSVSCLYCFNK